MITRSNTAGRASKRLASPVDGQSAALGDTTAGSSIPPKRVRRTAPLASTTKVEISSPNFRTAVDVQVALREVWRLESLGRCPTKEQAVHRHMNLYGTQRSSSSTEPTPPTKALEDAITKLRGIHQDQFRTYASGTLTEPFNLRISRPHCKFNGQIRIHSSNDRNDGIEERLKQWYNHSVVSGFGDLRSQETKEDKDVRHAREIGARDFSVEPELLQRIAVCWDSHFHANKGVRVEPYKIHLYSEGGHFKAHRDTPEKDLVGTFLLGLGDTVRSPCFQLDDQEFHSHPGQWVAFYPDVPHSVTRLPYGYRAVIAFKIFRKSTRNKCPHVDQLTKDVTDEMVPPFGILLERKYCLGTTELSGFDAIIHACLRAKHGVKVILLPVVVDVKATWGAEDESYDDDDWEQECTASVYPFTEAHIDYLVSIKSKDRDSEDEKKKKMAEVLKTSVKDIPFYSTDFAKSTITWSDKEQETCVSVLCAVGGARL
ncbi:hypothetical protein POSPLADRAFT_1171415 [Postia placenta MAD-698-R-SB12]|uniref:Prolyl 4-hydroxylase alpha subunit Fe(2+) 2OG dioxygenase domain-containing protein n=1 Tax=Postia placenta MAD-698-R-SB12 TaxID=670580 RepID=A0A1X6MVU5_9APHY|nr:hypothetical protein POSPLADRAFT_1171415 [Postia placenta MAD-698-R-SB12]OSX60346.1 hypothetical protein POSPLADRAFT_1171415 [Postia placenta MAD-698-R-SB12]